MERMLVIRHAWRTVRSGRTSANHDYFDAFLKSKSDVESLLKDRGKSISEADVLVLGCGYNYPDVILWSAFARRSVGVDVIGAFWKDGFRGKYQNLRKGGVGAARAFANTSLARLTYRGYFARLRELSRLQLDEQAQNLQTYDGRNLPFPNESFDVVCSNAVLEHVRPEDFSKLSEEIRRVTRPSGINYQLWHNYYSLTGAHVPDEIAQANPWGHLLADPRVRDWLNFSGTYLNRLLPEEIVGFLSPGFRRVAVQSVDKDHNKRGNGTAFAFEGEKLFTRDLEARLNQYPRETLLTRSYLFIGVKEGG